MRDQRIWAQNALDEWHNRKAFTHYHDEVLWLAAVKLHRCALSPYRYIVRSQCCAKICVCRLPQLQFLPLTKDASYIVEILILWSHFSFNNISNRKLYPCQSKICDDHGTDPISVSYIAFGFGYSPDASSCGGLYVWMLCFAVVVNVGWNAMG